MQQKNMSENTKRWQILVVDDDRDGLQVAVEILQLINAETFAAASGMEALSLLEGITPDCILLDLAMPDMDGWETYTRIRAIPAASGQIPVIALTSHASQGDREAALEWGFDGYVTKPYRIAHLVAEIERILQSGT